MGPLPRHLPGRDRRAFQLRRPLRGYAANDIFGLGWLGKWEWLEKWFKVDRAKLEKQKRYVDRFGVWLALVSWLPFVGDLFSIALGFYKTNPWLTAMLMLVGKTLRFFFWNLILGVI